MRQGIGGGRRPQGVHAKPPLSALVRDARVQLGAARGRCAGAGAPVGGQVAGPLGQSSALLRPSRGLRRR
jgi:hypothetical protein